MERPKCLIQQVSRVEAGPNLVVVDHTIIFILVVCHQCNVSYKVPMVYQFKVEVWCPGHQRNSRKTQFHADIQAHALKVVIL